MIDARMFKSGPFINFYMNMMMIGEQSGFNTSQFQTTSQRASTSSQGENGNNTNTTTDTTTNTDTVTTDSTTTAATTVVNATAPTTIFLLLLLYNRLLAVTVFSGITITSTTIYSKYHGQNSNYH